MTRVLEILAVVIFLAGLELAAGTLSHTFSRLEETIRLAFAGKSFVAPPGTFVLGGALVFVSASLGLTAYWARGQMKKVQPGTNCTICGSKTERVKRQAKHKLLSTLAGQRLTLRRCGHCNWTGLSVKQ